MSNTPNTLAVYLEGRKRADVAARLGISAAYLSQLSSGARMPGLETAARIERETGGEVPKTAWPNIAAMMKALGGDAA